MHLTKVYVIHTLHTNMKSLFYHFFSLILGASPSVVLPSHAHGDGKLTDLRLQPLFITEMKFMYILKYYILYEG